MSMESQKQREERRKGVTGLAVPAGLFIGMGVGFLIDDIVPGMFIGLGAGFLVMMLMRIVLGEW